MHGVAFLQDLALVMIVAGVVTLVFHFLKQPVVLGYLVAGFLIGPYSLPFSLVQDRETIQTLADLGVIFLMFSLGLEFNLRKLKRVGPPATLTAVFEISLMILLGNLVGALFGWGLTDRIFLGCILGISSTAILVTTLRESNQIKEEHGQLITGILIMEDIAVILMMVLLPGLAGTGGLPASHAVMTILKLFIFLVGLVTIGFIAVPRLLRFAARFQSNEMMLVTVLGLCFGVSLLAGKLEYSVALGAFITGAIVSESREAGWVESLMAPIRDLFMAVFFVAIGMLIDPAYVMEYAVPVLVITAVFIGGKIFACSTGIFLSGKSGRTAIRVGTGMAQLGEFSFVLAALGISLGVTSSFLYPVIAAVTVINAFLRPYLVKNADAITDGIYNRLPTSLSSSLTVYNRWITQLPVNKRRSPAMKFVKSLVIQIVLSVTLIVAAFLAAAFVVVRFPELFTWVPEVVGGAKSVAWLITVILMLPLYIAVIRKMQALAMLLAETAITSAVRDEARRMLLRKFVTNTLFLIQLVILGVLTLLAGAVLLPPFQVLFVFLLIVGLLILFFGPLFNKWYTRGKFALMEVFKEEAHPDRGAEPPQKALPVQLKDAEMDTVTIRSHAAADHLIRELELRTRTGSSIVALEREGVTEVNPGPDVELKMGDKLLLIGTHEQLDAARKVLEEDVSPSNP